MNAHEFIEIIREVVLTSAVRGVVKQMEKPSGRSPSQTLVDMSSWYGQLDDSQKTIVLNVVSMSAKDAVLNFLGVLDGIVAIEGKSKGVLKLYYERDTEKVLLNDHQNIHLNEILRQE